MSCLKCDVIEDVYFAYYSEAVSTAVGCTPVIWLYKVKF